MKNRCLFILPLCVISCFGCGGEQTQAPVEAKPPTDSLIGTWTYVSLSATLSDDQIAELHAEYEKRHVERPDQTFEAWLEESGRKLDGHRLQIIPPPFLAESAQLKFLPDGKFEFSTRGIAKVVQRQEDGVEVLTGWTLGHSASGIYAQTDDNLTLFLTQVSYELPKSIQGNAEFETQIRQSGAFEDKGDLEEAKSGFRQMIAGESGVVKYTFSEDERLMTTTTDVGVEWKWRKAEIPNF